MNKSSASKALVAAVCTGLAACGGGGSDASAGTSTSQSANGSGGAVASTLSFPVLSAMLQITSQVHQFAGTYTSGADSWTIAETYVPKPDAVYQGATRKLFNRLSAIRKNGALVYSDSEDLYYSSSPYQMYGAVGPGTETATFTQTGSLPTTATVGSGGDLVTFIGYSLASGTSQWTRNAAITWSLNADTASTALLCISFRSTSASGDSASDDCYRIDATGNTDGTGNFTIALNGTSITFK